MFMVYSLVTNLLYFYSMKCWKLPLEDLSREEMNKVVVNGVISTCPKYYQKLLTLRAVVSTQITVKPQAYGPRDGQSSADAVTKPNNYKGRLSVISVEEEQQQELEQDKPFIRYKIIIIIADHQHILGMPMFVPSETVPPVMR